MDIKTLMIFVQFMVYSREGVVFYYMDKTLANSTCGHLIDEASHRQDELLADEFKHNPNNAKFFSNESDFITANRINFLNFANMSDDMRGDSTLLKNRSKYSATKFHFLKRVVIYFENWDQANSTYVPDEISEMATRGSPLLVYKLYCGPDGKQPIVCGRTLDELGAEAVDTSQIEIAHVCPPEANNLVASDHANSSTMAPVEGISIQHVDLKGQNGEIRLSLINNSLTGLQMTMTTKEEHSDDTEVHLYSLMRHNSTYCKLRCHEERYGATSSKNSYRTAFLEGNTFFQSNRNCLTCFQEETPTKWGPDLYDWIIISLASLIWLLYLLSNIIGVKYYAPSQVSIQATLLASSCAIKHLQESTQFILRWLAAPIEHREICLVEVLLYTSQMVLLLSIVLARYISWQRCLVLLSGALMSMLAFRHHQDRTTQPDLLMDCITQADDGMTLAIISLIIVLTMVSSRKLIWNDIVALTQRRTAAEPIVGPNILRRLAMDVLIFFSVKYTYKGQHGWVNHLTEPDNCALIPLALLFVRSLEIEQIHTSNEDS